MRATIFPYTIILTKAPRRFFLNFYYQTTFMLLTYDATCFMSRQEGSIETRMLPTPHFR